MHFHHQQLHFLSKEDMEKISNLKQGGEALFCKDLDGMIKRLAERKK